MPTNEERRKVAARLREQKTWDICTEYEHCVGDICDAVFGDDGDLNDMFRLQTALADLIDPEPEIDKRESIRCPNCGASNYGVNYLTSTLIGWTPRYVDGVQVNKDPNKTTKHCTCFSCGSDFEYKVD